MTSKILKNEENLTTISADVAGESQSLEFLWGYGLHIVWDATGGGQGTVIAQESNDGVNWHAVSGVTQAMNNNTGSVYFHKPDQMCMYVRMHVTHTAGTIPAVNAFWSAKG